MVNLRTTALLLTAAGFCSAGCRPSIEGRSSVVDSERVLAIRSEPVEARDNAPVKYQALFVGADGPADASALDWALCRARKPLAAPGFVAQACFARKGDLLSSLGHGDQASGLIAKDACQLFGPMPPAPMKGEPNGRPADPDTTGGYYQPVRVLVPGAAPADDLYFVGMSRLVCGLGGATAEQSAQYAMRYRPNENPALASVVRVQSGGDQALSLASSSKLLRVQPNERLTLRASWARCPSKPKCGDGICSPLETVTGCMQDCSGAVPKGCTGAEPYAYLDPGQGAVVDRHESIRVSWFANAGDFQHDRTGRSEAEASQTDTENEWTAPSTPGEVFLWVVIRDDRGGVGWESYKLDVRR